MAKSDESADEDGRWSPGASWKINRDNRARLSMQPIIEETGAEAEMAEVIVWTDDC